MKRKNYIEIEELDDCMLMEITKHKWLLSEKAGRNVGYKKAVDDWMRNHFSDWSRHQKKLLLDIL